MFPVTVVAPAARVPLVDTACDPKLGLILVPAIAALELTSALTILSSIILADATELSANSRAPTESVANCEAVIVSFFILAAVIAKSVTSAVCILSCLENNTCSRLLFKSEARIVDPEAKIALALSTFVALYTFTLAVPLAGAVVNLIVVAVKNS